MQPITTALMFIVLLVPCAGAQDLNVEGKVYHANTRETLSGVNIYMKGTNIGTSSYRDGSFILRIPDVQDVAILVFDHISFYPLEVPLQVALETERFFLKPQVIQLPAVSVTGEKQPPVLLKDIPQAYTVVEAKYFDGRGYTDLGDILKAEQSIQIDEEASGSKTVSIRGGNPDDVIVLYDGMKINSISNHSFDFSLINLEDVKQVEIVRGGNSALYGSGAVSGVINIVPKTFRDYTIKIQNRLGTYTTADYNIQLHRNVFKRLDMAYSFRKGDARRKFLDETGFDYYALDNKSTYHTANLTYNLQEDWQDESDKNLRLLFFRSNLDYRNNKYAQGVVNMNQILSLRYTGNLWKINNLNMSVSYQWLDSDWSVSSDPTPFEINYSNRAVRFNLEKRFLNIEGIEFIAAYQFEHGELDYTDNSVYTTPSEGFQSALLTRQKHGGVGVLKLHVPTNSKFLQTTDFNLSFRYETAGNRYSNLIHHTLNSVTVGEEYDPDEGDWKEAMVNFSSSLLGKNNRFGLNAHMNFGKNFKFPTMVQQIGNPLALDTFYRVYEPNLYPEWSNHYEVGVDFITDISQGLTLNGWEVGFNVFTTRYTNKIRTYSALFSPITLYDNVADAAISGFESKAKLFTMQKKLNFELLASIYSISEKSAFPYKADTKFIFNTFFDHQGYAFQFTWYWESDKLAWIRGDKNRLYEEILPSKANIDIHLSKRFEIWKIKLLANVTGLNILGDSLEIDGFAIRNSRFFLTLGVQY